MQQPPPPPPCLCKGTGPFLSSMDVCLFNFRPGGAGRPHVSYTRGSTGTMTFDLRTKPLPTAFLTALDDALQVPPPCPTASLSAMQFTPLRLPMPCPCHPNVPPCRTHVPIPTARHYLLLPPDGAGDEEDADNGEQDEDPDDEDLEGDGDGDDDDGGGDGEGLLLGAPADGVETGERCAYWFRPCEVWEVRGADVTLSPVHMAAAGLVHPQRGLSIRFPRFMGKRSDKTLRQATTPQELAALFKKQAQGQDAI